MTPIVKKLLWKRRQKFWYGIVACLTALLCIFVSPVVARETVNQRFTASIVSNAMCNLFLKPLSKPLPEAERGFNSCSPSLVGKGLGVRFER
ncbi:hypothetical protein, partial [Nostoc sp. UHCC 0251]|uniref:hypothetical protein n=1 Tax=Nostoc sp. UHCC 0251 TaxID=3110240 RepID=UPI002B216559